MNAVERQLVEHYRDVRSRTRPVSRPINHIKLIASDAAAAQNSESDHEESVVDDGGVVIEAVTYVPLITSGIELAPVKWSTKFAAEVTGVEWPADRKILVADIVKFVSRFTGISAADLKSTRRNKPIASARHCVSALARELTSQSYPEIGRCLGNRDHTTILHSVRVVSKLEADGDPIVSGIMSCARRYFCEGCE